MKTVPVAGVKPREAAALHGLRVVEFAHVIAGPMAGTLLADFGADVVHVEPPSGDDARHLGPAKDGVNLWWKVLGRNKRSVTLDLHTEADTRTAYRLVERADVVIVTLRVDTLERWGLDFEAVRRLNPKVIYLQISGFGSDTSLRTSPGFGKVGEAMSGVVNITGEADGPPVHVGFSHGDAMTGLMGAFAILSALYRKDTDPAFRGEWIDLALFETIFRMIEPQVIYFDQLGYEMTRHGNTMPIAPQGVINAFQAADAAWVTVSAATARAVQSIVRLLDLPEDDYLTREQHREGAAELDRSLGEWIAARPADDALRMLQDYGVVASRIFSVNDILEDVTYRQRGDIVSVDDAQLGPIKMSAALPHLRNHSGDVWWSGPEVGADNHWVAEGWLGSDE